MTVGSRLMLCCTASLLMVTATAQAQFGGPVAIGAGSEMERYLRVLQLVGRAPAGQWTVRPFGPLERLALRPVQAHPWAAHVNPGANRGAWAVVPPSMALLFNSSFPYGFNDGPVWAGKGATIVGSAGVAGAVSRISGQLAPIAFLAQNAGFETARDISTGLPTFGDWLGQGHTIDLPQRFGPRSYARLDPGETSIRFDSRLFTLGLSSESQVWGPALEHPILLGNNAGGIPRLFIGTGAPVNLHVARVNARVFWGRVDQSAYGRGDPNTAKHFASGVVGTLRVNGSSGLELGAGRFFHTYWGRGELGDVPWTRPFGVLFKRGLTTATNPNGDDPDNQLASVFFRLAPRAAGFEVYGEYGREDHAGDPRDFIGEPDHDAAYLVGFQRAWARADSQSISVLRWEILNSRLSHLSGQAPWYIHSYITQGHTQRGQLLAAPGGYGGGGATLAFDRYSARGRWTIRFDRLLIGEPLLPNFLPQSSGADVSYALRAEMARFGRRGESVNSIGLVRELNRHFSHDAWNLNVMSRFALNRTGAPK